MRVMLICQAGLSTGIMKEKIKEAAKKEGKEIEMQAVGLDSFEPLIPDCDFILLGPQIKYAEKNIRKVVQNRVPVMMIESIDFGRMQGEVVYKKMMNVVHQGE